MNSSKESNELIFICNHEDVKLKVKATGKIIFTDDFYGDPKCFLIDKQNNWAFVGGEHLSAWSKSGIAINIHNHLKWIYALRVKDSSTIEVLTDPWSPTSSIWEVNTETFKSKKIKDFNNYKEKEYTENVIW